MKPAHRTEFLTVPREEAKIAAQGARYGPQVGRPGSLAPLADNITDQGGIIVEGRRAEFR